MANEQQALLLVLRSIESFLPDLVPLGSPWLPHKAVEMDVSPGKLSAPIRSNSESLFSGSLFVLSLISVMLIFCFPRILLLFLHLQLSRSYASCATRG
jgi:hypothetical protein